MTDRASRARRRGRGFSYRDEEGVTLTEAATLDRIAALAIPPAWTEVWISANPRCHLQATGRDAKGRKQYRYHDAFSAARPRPNTPAWPPSAAPCPAFAPGSTRISAGAGQCARRCWLPSCG